MNPQHSSPLFGDAERASSSVVTPKRKRPALQPVFKEYQQNQATFLPPNVDDLLPPGHLARVVNDTLEQMKLTFLIHEYPGGGTSSFHPKMMVKIIIYAYLTKIYTSRPIAKAMRENIAFMWLSGGQRPSFDTINDFRSSRFREMLDTVFASLVEFLIEKGYIKAETYFVDGTKIAANANKYSYVWRKNSERYRAAVQQKIREQLQYIDELNRQEQAQYGTKDLPEEGKDIVVTSDEVAKQVERLNRLIAPPPVLPPPHDGGGGTAPSAASEADTSFSASMISGETPEIIETPKATNVVTPPPMPETGKKIARALKTIEGKYLPQLQRYEHQLAQLGERNSYSKTDPDATFFRMKTTDELLPSYNVHLSTEGQWITGFSIHQFASDTDCFIPHVQEILALQQQKPQNWMGDSAFGSEENYHFLHQQQIGNYLKYSMYHQEKKKTKPKYFGKEAFAYNQETDSFQCPAGRILLFQSKTFPVKKTGFKSVVRVYQCADCTECPLRAQCLRGKGNRTVQVNIRLDYYRAQARSNLNSPFGVQVRKQRGVDVEPTFGDIKYNQGFRRFHLRSTSKVRIEVGLLSIAHNMKKLSRAALAA